MEYETYAAYVKSLPVSDLRTMLLLYTLKPNNTALSKVECRNLLLSKYVMSDEVYNLYLDMYRRLSNIQKMHLKDYQSNYYRDINTYIFNDYINIQNAPRKIPLDKFGVQIPKKIDPVLLREFDTIYKQRKEYFQDTTGMENLQKTINKLFSDNIVTYNNYLRILNNSIRNLYNIVSTNEIIHDIILFRGERYSESPKTKASLTIDAGFDRLKQLLNIKKNEVIENKHFVSCSLNPFVAFDFAGDACCLYRYFIKKGLHGIMLPSTSTASEYCAISGEFELVLAPHIMKIINTHIITKDGVYSEKNILQNFISKKPEGYTVIDVEIVGLLPPPTLRDMYDDDESTPVKK